MRPFCRYGARGADALSPMLYAAAVLYICLLSMRYCGARDALCLSALRRRKDGDDGR